MPDRWHEVPTKHDNWKLFVLDGIRTPSQPKPRAWYGITLCVFILLTICLLWRFGA